MMRIYILTALLHVALGMQPLLTSPGNVSVLLFVDIHSGYHDNGTCTGLQWDNLEMTLALLGKIGLGENKGIELYDTCGSRVNTLRILKERLQTGNCSVTSFPTAAGVVSMTTTDVADAITSACQVADLLHVQVRTSAEETGSSPPGVFTVELASKSIVQLTTSLLQQAGWDYITTIYDKHPISLREHDMFVTLAKENGVCIQYSHNSTQNDFDFSQVKTKGVLIFTANISDFKNIVDKLPPMTSILFITQNSLQHEINFIENGAILTDGPSNFVSNFSDLLDHMLLSWSSNSLIVDSFISKYNCNVNTSVDLNSSSASNFLSCATNDELIAAMNRTTSSRRSHVVSGALQLLHHAASQMGENNCTTLSATSCQDKGHSLFSSILEADETGSTLSQPPYNVAVTRVVNGSVTKHDIFRVGISSIEPEISVLFNENLLPTSHCSWCPECEASWINDNTIEYKGNYFYYPGDILIAGLFPLTLSWNQQTRPSCGGFAVQNQTDILAEAFVYAIRTFHERYSNVLPNVKVGGLVLDTCSSNERASQVVLNFESGLYKFASTGGSWMPYPAITPAYVIPSSPTSPSVKTAISSFGKLAMSSTTDGDIFKQTTLIYDANSVNVEVITSLLKSTGWSMFGLVTSEGVGSGMSAELFEAARKLNICAEFEVKLSQEPVNVNIVIEKIKQSKSTAVVIAATSEDVGLFFRSLTSNKITKTWILVETRANWLDIQSHPLPHGTVIIQVKGKDNKKFNEELSKQLTNVTTTNASPFIQQFSEARKSCADCVSPLNDMQALLEASDVIKTVDLVLHSMNTTVAALCPPDGSLCKRFATEGASRMLSEIDSVEFNYNGETIRMDSGVTPRQNYVILNFKTLGLVQVGQWSENSLSLQTELLASYDSRGDQLVTLRPSACFTTACACVNMNMTSNTSSTSVLDVIDPEKGYADSTAKFDTNLWCIVVVVIAASGSFFTAILMIYIMCKVCHGALIRRYLLLGILLLVAMVFLFMSVLPFVFTPSEYVCGMRYFAHGFSYAFCFAIILSKMATLRDYKYIGLGGEISRLNQMLFVFFVTAVQIAIGVEWWGLRHQTVIETVFVQERMGVIQEITHYACDFSRKDFLAYHSYVIFLVVVCALYSISVRNETKNMKEARLLLVCSWFCLCLWVAIIVTILTLDRDLLEAVCAIGVTANALTMLVIIYLPKLTALSRLKYEVSQTKRTKQNGYKVDPDFQFERPYSLPGTMGTMRSSITDKTVSTSPRSLANFDTSMSY